MAGTFLLAHLDAERGGAGRAQAGGNGPHVPRASTLTCRQEGRGHGRGRRPGGGAVRTWRRGGPPAGSAGAGAGEGGWPGRAPSRGTFLAGKGAIVCSYSWYVRRAGRPRAVGAPLPGSPGEGRRPGGRRREGCGQDAGAGAPPLRGEDGGPRSGGRRGSGSVARATASGRTVASPSPDCPTTKAAAAGSPGAPWGWGSGGGTEAATGRPRGGPGRGIPGGRWPRCDF